MKTVITILRSHRILKGMVFFLIAFFAVNALAQGGGGGGGSSGVGAIASNITGSFKALGQLVLAIAFLAGVGFVMAAIFKFKQHKDNPSQIPLGTPVAMLVIGIVLMFLPNLIAPAGTTIFGSSATTGGFKGNITSGLIPGAS